MHKALECWMPARAPALPARGLHRHGRGHNYLAFYTSSRVALRNLDLFIIID